MLDLEISSAAVAIWGSECLYGDSQAQKKSEAGDDQKGFSHDESPLVSNLFLCARKPDDVHWT